MGDISFTQIHKSRKLGAVRDLPNISLPESTICKSCQFGKKTRVKFNAKEGSTSKPLELIHTDLCGPIRKKSPHGEQYYILFIDDFSRMCWIGLLKHKDESFENFNIFKGLVENELDLKIKCLDLTEEENIYHMNSLIFMNIMAQKTIFCSQNPTTKWHGRKNE